jgi:hypothetical protein
MVYNVSFGTPVLFGYHPLPAAFASEQRFWILKLLAGGKAADQPIIRRARELGDWLAPDEACLLCPP